MTEGNSLWWVRRFSRFKIPNFEFESNKIRAVRQRHGLNFGDD